MAGHSDTAAIVLAAGDGKRLRSELPKVLHRVAGRPLLVHVLAALEPLGLGRTIVVASPRKDLIAETVGGAGVAAGVEYAVQEVPRGTADAAMQGLPMLTDDIRRVLVLAGDAPLITTDTISGLIERHEEEGAVLSVLTARMADPAGYGRVVRNPTGQIERIVEERDATEDERAVVEINVGTYVFEVDALRRALEQVGTDNAQGEYYLTDTVALLLSEGAGVASYEAPAVEAAGVNSRMHLAEVSHILRTRANVKWMSEGVTIVDPASTYIDAGVTIGQDATIYPFTFLEGTSKIGAGAEVGPQARVIDSEIGEGATVTFAVVRDSEVGASASVGPFASLRPGTKLGPGGRIGTFVETKATTIGPDSKANHLAYLGDATIGSGVNVGAGTITCNWDGRSKHQTVIDDDAYIGSDTMLVAPTHIGKRAATGAGSVVKGDVPDDALAVGVPARVLKGKGDKMDRGDRTSGERRE